MSSGAVLEIRDLTFSYGKEPLLRNASFQVMEREWVSMVGPNGGGKTTLLKLILGLLRPDGGSIRVFGQPPAESRGRIGYVPQHSAFDPQFPVSAMDVVLMGHLGRARRFGPYPRSARRSARAALEEVDLARLGGRSFAELSGGQRQRVLIARALASAPDLLLLDEPTSNLDAGAESDFQQLLRKLQERLTILLVSHDLAVVSEHATKVVCVKGAVSVHPTAELTGDLIRDLYGQDVRLVRHDHDCLRHCEMDGRDG